MGHRQKRERERERGKERPTPDGWDGWREDEEMPDGKVEKAIPHLREERGSVAGQHYSIRGSRYCGSNQNFKIGISDGGAVNEAQPHIGLPRLLVCPNLRAGNHDVLLADKIRLTLEEEE